MNQIFSMIQDENKSKLYSKYNKKARQIRDGMERPNLDKHGRRIGESTHLMVHEVGEAIGAEPGKWYAFPTLFPSLDKNKPNRWIDYDKGKDIRGAYLEAVKRDEVFEFGSDKKAAKKFSLGGYKKVLGKLNGKY